MPEGTGRAERLTSRLEEAVGGTAYINERKLSERCLVARSGRRAQVCGVAVPYAARRRVEVAKDRICGPCARFRAVATDRGKAAPGHCAGAVPRGGDVSFERAGVLHGGAC